MKFPSFCVLFLLLALAVHFLLTGYFSFTTYPRQGPLAAISERYTVPAFYQNWSLFAPDVPTYDAQLEYRIASAGSWMNWTDAGKGKGRLEMIEQSYVVGLAWQVVKNLYTSNDRTQFDRIVQSGAYQQAVEYVRRSTRETPSDSLQLRLVFRFTPPPDKAYTFQRSELEFPVTTYAGAH